MSQITDEQILKEAKQRLSKLIEEARVAEVEKEKRDIAILKAKVVIDLFSETVDAGEDVKEISFDTTTPTPTPIHFSTEETKFTVPEGTWQDKIKACLKFANKVLTIAKIVEMLKPFNSDMTEKQLTGVVSNTVNTMLKKETIKVFQPPVKMKGYFYGNPLWFEGSDLREEYKPDLKKKLLW